MSDPYVLSLALGKRGTLFTTYSPSLPNLHTFKDSKGYVRVEPLHPPIPSDRGGPFIQEFGESFISNTPARGRQPSVRPKQKAPTPPVRKDYMNMEINEPNIAQI